MMMSDHKAKHYDAQSPRTAPKGVYDVERVTPTASYEVEDTNEQDDYGPTQQIETSSMPDFDPVTFRKKLCIAVVFASVILVILYLVFSGSGRTTARSGVDPSPSHYQTNGVQVVKDGKGSEYTILAIYDRDTDYYTQGYYFVESTGQLLESAGYWGKSRIQYTEITEPKETGARGKITVKTYTPNSGGVFAEGCTLVQQKGKTWVYQLTWTDREIYRYDENLKFDKSFKMPADLKEGWGMSHNPLNQNELYVTDSGAYVFTLVLNDAETEFKVISKKLITNNNRSPISSLNELEATTKTLFSNVYLSRNVELLDRETGAFKREIDMSRLVDLANEENQRVKGKLLNGGQCLNGIAYDSKNDVFYFTGKEWPLVFKVRIPREYYS